MNEKDHHKSSPFHAKGLFSLGKITTAHSLDLHIMPLEKIWVLTRCFNPKTQWGARLVLDTFLESGRDGEKIWPKNPGRCLVSNILLKHLHRLAKEIVPFVVACIKILLISDQSLSPILPAHFSLESSFPKWTCVYPGWHIPARRAVQVFAPNFPLLIQFPLKCISVHPELSPLLGERPSNLDILPLTSHCHLFLVTAHHLSVLCFTKSNIGLRDQPLFSPTYS